MRFRKTENIRLWPFQRVHLAQNASRKNIFFKHFGADGSLRGRTNHSRNPAVFPTVQNKENGLRLIKDVYFTNPRCQTACQHKLNLVMWTNDSCTMRQVNFYWLDHCLYVGPETFYRTLVNTLYLLYFSPQRLILITETFFSFLRFRFILAPLYNVI